MTFCNMLAHVSVRRFKSLVTAAGIANRFLYNVRMHVPVSVYKFCSQPDCLANIDKVRCFLLKEMDCFICIEERQNVLFPSLLFKSK